VGDKPDEIPHFHNCSNGNWPGGLVPDYIIVEIAGLEVSPYWPYDPPPKAEGVFVCKFRSCVTYTSDAVFIVSGIELSKVIVNIFGSEIWVAGTTTILGKQSFGNTQESLPTSNFDNMLNPQQQPYYNGQASIEFFLDGSAPPASWGPSDLLGVPEDGNYLAEMGYAGLSENNYRYCAKHNKSNLKLKMES